MAKDKTSTNAEESSSSETSEQEVSVNPKCKKEGSKRKAATDRKSEKDSPDENETEIENSKNKIIPLLDQPAVVEGPRSRKTIKVFDATIPISRKLDIKIPDAKGVPLGLIRVVSLRLKQLDDIVIKELHRTLFGRTFGKTSALINNLCQFRGFLFGKDSSEYKNKIHVLGTKFSLGELKQLLYVFNIDEMIKTKEEGIKLVLDFLLHPKRIKSVTKPAPFGHPRRKATKRNYFEADFESVVRKKKKKHLLKDDESPKKSTTKNKSKKNEGTTENGENGDALQKEEEEAESDNNELKKPAKKRKRNQIIDEEEGEKEDDEPLKKSEFTGARAKRNGKNASKKKSSAKISKDEEKVSEATDLTDGELKEFLKGILADADLEQTTMKTIYGLIRDRYPNYDSSSKKEFIRDVVKSLVRTSE